MDKLFLTLEKIILNTYRITQGVLKLRLLIVLLPKKKLVSNKIIDMQYQNHFICSSI